MQFLISISYLLTLFSELLYKHFFLHIIFNLNNNMIRYVHRDRGLDGITKKIMDQDMSLPFCSRKNPQSSWEIK